MSSAIGSSKKRSHIMDDDPNDDALLLLSQHDDNDACNKKEETPLPLCHLQHHDEAEEQEGISVQQQQQQQQQQQRGDHNNESLPMKKKLKYYDNDNDGYNNDNASSSSESVSSSQNHNNNLPRRRRRKLSYTYCDHGRRTNDEIHSSITLNPVVTIFLDTPQMQRLRHLKQLGTAEFVYINCNHTRFEHSLGVAHLAAKLCQQIQQRQSGLQCTSKDVLCVELAGLFHDIGHGPFSHSYEEFVLDIHPQYMNANQHLNEYYGQFPNVPNNWQHEISSLLMIDAALEHLGLYMDINQLDKPLQMIPDRDDGIDPMSIHPASDPTMILTSRDFVFIKEAIYGKPIPEIETKLGKLGFHGRTEIYQEWLYDIVSNSHSGLDVDKIDYYARDARRALRDSGEIDKILLEESVVAWSHCTNPHKCVKCCGRQHQRCRNENSKEEDPQRRQYDVCQHDGMHLMICYPDKLIKPCMTFFKQRFNLHSKIYHHKTNDAAQFMVSDILCKADPYFLLPIAPLDGGQSVSSTGAAKTDYTSLPLSRAMLHPGSYLRLTDSMIDVIANTDKPELDEARKLIHRLRSRDLYKCVAIRVIRWTEDDRHRRIWQLREDEITNQIVSCIRGEHQTEDGSLIRLERDDVIVQKCKIHHGLKEKDPVSRIRFLQKNQLDMAASPDFRNLPEARPAKKEDYESQLPRVLMECSLRIFCRDGAKDKCDLVRHQFEVWWEDGLRDMEQTRNGGGDVVAAEEAFVCTQESEPEDDNDDDDDDLSAADAAVAPPPDENQHLNGSKHCLTPSAITPPRKNIGPL